MSLLTIIPAFLVTIGVLVTVHEFGHFWVARKLGVKVLRFSVGFGKPLWTRVSKDPDHIEYVVAALPLGGYVKMLDERECEEGEIIPLTLLPRAFNRQPIWKRAAIVVAGPVANFLLAIILYALIFMVGDQVRYAYVDVKPSTPAAAAGFQSGDLITKINQQSVASMDEFALLLMDEYLKSPDKLEITVKNQEGFEAVRSLNVENTTLLENPDNVLDKVGLDLWYPPHPLVIEKALSDAPAGRAGLQAGDTITRVDDHAVNNARDFIVYVQAHEAKPLHLEVLRAGAPVKIDVTPLKTPEGNVQIGIQFQPPQGIKEKLYFTQSFGVVDSFVLGAKKTWDMSVLSLKLIGRMLTGDVSVKNINGAITIAQVAGQAASIGLITFLGFLAVVSLSLGLLNLMPIPMLDGGHLLYYLIEWIKGSPVSPEVEAMGLRIGMAIIAALMTLALYNDFTRLIKYL